MQVEFKKVNWLSDKYINKYGLRDWTWKAVVDGIIAENVVVL